MAKLRMGDAKDDIHVCIMCLRAIMNNKVRIINVPPDFVPHIASYPKDL